jgi:hypothetical protein
MLPLAAVLLMCLSACASPPREAGLWQELPRQVARQPSFAPACPVPTDKAGRDLIKGELVAAIAAGVPPNKLATDWERLDDAAQACRGKRS